MDLLDMLLDLDFGIANLLDLLLDLLDLLLDLDFLIVDLTALL